MYYWSFGSSSILDPEKSFCSLAVGTQDERRIWIYQTRKLISVCLFILGECDNSHQDIFALTSLAMRLAVVLTDVKGWKCIADDNLASGRNARSVGTCLKDTHCVFCSFHGQRAKVRINKYEKTDLLRTHNIFIQTRRTRNTQLINFFYIYFGNSL